MLLGCFRLFGTVRELWVAAGVLLRGCYGVLGCLEVTREFWAAARVFLECFGLRRGC